VRSDRNTKAEPGFIKRRNRINEAFSPQGGRRCRHQPEAQLHRSLVEHLRWCARSDVWWAHIPNGGARTAIEGAIFKSLGVQPGAPDLLVVRAGQALFIECKAPGRKLSPSQVECHEALRRAGAAVETTDNIDGALGFLRRHGVLRSRKISQVSAADGRRGRVNRDFINQLIGRMPGKENRALVAASSRS
jgi:hypothetical protein